VQNTKRGFYLYCGNTNLVSCHAESPQLKKEAELSYFSQARERLETKNFVFCFFAKSLAKFVFLHFRENVRNDKNILITIIFPKMFVFAHIFAKILVFAKICERKGHMRAIAAA
jgi:hypothetical protein